MKENVPRTDIKMLEKELVSEKEWKYRGEAKASARPVNSLADMDIDFETNLINVPITKDENSAIFKYTCQRFREKTFDNYEFKIPDDVVKEEAYDVELIESNREVFELYEKIERSIRSMLDYGSGDFA